jgi:hypothetical protein
VIDFSAAYAPFFSGVYGTKDIAVGKLDDLAGKTLGATRGAIEEQEISKAVPSSTTVKRYEDNNATISAFISGQVDLIATGNVVAAVIAEKSKARPPVLKFVMKESPCYIGMNKDEPKLMAKVNEIIAKAKASGELNTISKWLKADLPACRARRPSGCLVFETSCPTGTCCCGLIFTIVLTLVSTSRDRNRHRGVGARFLPLGRLAVAPMSDHPQYPFIVVLHFSGYAAGSNLEYPSAMTINLGLFPGLFARIGGAEATSRPRKPACRACRSCAMSC